MILANCLRVFANPVSFSTSKSLEDLNVITFIHVQLLSAGLALFVDLYKQEPRWARWSNSRHLWPEVPHDPHASDWPWKQLERSVEEHAMYHTISWPYIFLICLFMSHFSTLYCILSYNSSLKFIRCFNWSRKSSNTPSPHIQPSTAVFPHLGSTQGSTSPEGLPPRLERRNTHCSRCSTPPISPTLRRCISRNHEAMKGLNKICQDDVCISWTWSSSLIDSDCTKSLDTSDQSLPHHH